MNPIVLIACSATKAQTPCAAQLLYRGSLFRASVRYAYALGSDNSWAILSAKHGLLHPFDYVEPYDYRLPKGLGDRSRWARGVIDKMVTLGYFSYVKDHPIVMLAGQDYRDPLWHMIKERFGIECSVPLAGIVGIGRQISELKRLTEGLKAPKSSAKSLIS
jgi:hypothetical protein